MGVVYAARHVATDALRAIKTIKTLDPEEVLRFRREVEALVRVEGHTNMVRIHGTGEAGGRLYLIQELISGGDLSERLRQGPLPARDAAAIVRDVARGLAHAHAAGVLHRDLKPANILFDEAGVPKLVDFGLAKVAGQGSLTGTSDLLGTPAYMAPEQAISDHARVDERTDVYGLGALLYHCLAGQPPFQGPLLSVLNDAVNTAPTPPSRIAPDVDRGLERICLAALTKSPEHRPPSAEAMAERLDDWLEGERDAPNGLWLIAGLALVIVVALGLRGSLRETGEQVDPTTTAPPTPSASPTAPRTPPPSPTPSAKLIAPEWQAHERESSWPNARADHQLVYYPPLRRCLLYGGRLTKGLARRLYSWDGKAWAPEQTIRPLPPRQEHAMAYDPLRKSIVVVGGKSPTSPALKEHREWRGGRWKPRPSLPVGLAAPAVTIDDQGTLWVFGGRTRLRTGSDEYSTRLLKLAAGGTDWVEIERAPNAAWPSGREQHAFAHHQGQLLLLGGITTEREILVDFWIWNGGWKRQQPPKGLLPRRAASLASIGDGLLLCGGAQVGVGGLLSDLWLWRGTGWILVEIPSTPMLRGAAMAPFPPGDAIVLVGGRTSSTGWSTKTHVLRGVSALPR